MTARTKKSLPACAHVTIDPSIEEIDKIPLSETEILQFTLLQKGLKSATQQTYGVPYCAAIGLAASIPMTRRFLAIAHDFERKIKIVFFRTAGCYVPLWLASQGISVEIIEDNLERNSWAKMIGDYFFSNINYEQEKTCSPEPVFHVTDSKNFENYSSGSKCDIFWIGQDISKITTHQKLEKILKVARSKVIASDIGLIGCPKPCDFSSILWSSAQNKHLRTTISEEFLFFQPFEINSRPATMQLFNQTEIQIDTLTDLNIRLLARDLGISLTKNAEIKQPVSSVESVIKGFLQ